MNKGNQKWLQLILLKTLFLIFMKLGVVHISQSTSHSFMVETKILLNSKLLLHHNILKVGETLKIVYLFCTMIRKHHWMMAANFCLYTFLVGKSTTFRTTVSIFTILKRLIVNQICVCVLYVCLLNFISYPLSTRPS